MKTPEELAISMWNKGGHGLDLEEVVAIITADRKDLMSEVARKKKKIIKVKDDPELYCAITGYNHAINDIIKSLSK